MNRRFKTATPIRRLRKHKPEAAPQDESFISQEDFITLVMERESLEHLLHAINNTATALLGSKDEDTFEANLLVGMQMAGACINVDRTLIWQNEVKNSELNYVLKYIWLNDPDDKKAPVVGTTYNYHRDNPVWEENLRNGENVNGPVSELTSLEQEVLGVYGPVSILVLPVFLEEHFWGFVSFDDLHIERKFSKDEVHVLNTSALMMVSALNRYSQSVKLNKAYRYSQLMLDATPLSCLIWDRNNKILDCNEEAVRLFQMSDKEEFIRRHKECTPMFQPNGKLSLEKFNYMLTNAFSIGFWRDEFVHQLSDGTVLPTEVTLVRVETDNGDVVASYARDLREHRRMMNEIEHRDRLLNTAKDVAELLLQAEPGEFDEVLIKCLRMTALAVNVSRAYIWQNTVLPNGKLSGNKLFEWMDDGIDYSVDNYVGVPYEDFMPELESVLSKGEFINGPAGSLSEKSYTIFEPLGVKSLLIVPVFLNNQFWGFVGFDDFDSVRVFSENEESILRSGCLLIANALLRNDMTQNLQDSAVRLEAALTEARSASRAKSNFLSNMSHEIRTPINAITGMTAIGKASGDMDRKNYAFDRIEDASKHLLGVINDVLDMSKIEAAKFELSMIEFDFARMVQKVVDVINFKVNEKNQTLNVELDGNIPPVLIGDDQRIAQVITNLLSNAVKFTPESQAITLSAHFLRNERNGCLMEVTVTDSGIGISKEQQAKLFTTFTQAESSTTRKFGGTGLGLAISKHIVELMGGRIWVESEPGKGSTFGFELTLERGLKAEDATAETAPLEDGDNDGIFKGYRLLLAEDMEINREIVIVMLENTGLEIDCAENGVETVKMIEENPERYGMIFMDVQMPEMDGLEATRRIRQLPGPYAKELPIVAMSANVFREDIEECLEAGMNSHVGKPLDFTEVFEKLKYFLTEYNVKEVNH